MSTPEPPDRGEPEPAERPPPDPTAEAPFDPYRFGLPEHPVPPEYAPPGYVFPTTPPTAPPSGPPAGPAPGNPWAPPAALPPTQSSGPGYPGQPQYPQNPQYPQYPHPPYGAPPPPLYDAYGRQPRPGNGKAIAALVLGIFSLVFFWLNILDLVLIIPAVIFGILGLNDARVRGKGGRGQAIAGLVCAGVAVVLAVIFLLVALHAANKCGGVDHSGDPGFNQCFRDNFF